MYSVLRHGALKPYWCEELQELKKASIDAYNLWMLCDSWPYDKTYDTQVLSLE